MSDANQLVQCELHSETPATFVCRHVRFGVACGFHCSADDPADRWPDAWCDLCEVGLEREGEWNDSNDPDISLLCTGCYEIARARNEQLPAPLLPRQLSVSASQFEAFAEQACDRCKVRQDATQRAWPKFASARRWHWDDETRTIRFFDDQIEKAIVADVTMAGSFSARTSTWMWAWGNPSYTGSNRAKVDPVRVFGEVRGIEKLQNARWRAEEVDCWEVSQIAADLLGAAAIYRAPMDHLMVFMLLSNFRDLCLS